MNFLSGFVTIVGRPNAGKSTLLNRLVGQKVAIISDKPQTTRNKILAVLTTGDSQVIFIDTPGIHKPKHLLGKFMINTAKRALQEVDLILYVVDASAKPGAGEDYVLETLKNVATPVFLVLNKVDLVNKENLLPLIAEYCSRRQFAEVVPVSALTGDNLDELQALILPCLPPGPQYYPADVTSDQPEQFVIAEIIREKVLQLTREEIPHSVAVVVTEEEERPNQVVYLAATIYTERDSQKGILIGKGGQMLREIGQLARTDLENLLGSKLFLDLRVKVRKDWRRRETDLRNLGYDHRLQ